MQFAKFLSLDLFATSDGEKETSYVVIGEKGRAQLVRDSREAIAMTVSETQKLPINFTQVRQ